MSRKTGVAESEHAVVLKLWVVLSRAHQAGAELAKLDVARGELSLTEFATHSEHKTRAASRVPPSCMQV